MLKTRNGRTRTLNYICAGITFILLVLQFTPFWKFNGNLASINGYVWLYPKNKELAEWFVSNLGRDFNIYSVVIPSVLILFFGFFGLFLCIKKSHSGLSPLLPAGASLIVIYSHVLIPVFRLGFTWNIQLVLSILILIVALLMIVNYLTER